MTLFLDIILICFSVVCFIQLIYFGFVFSKFSFFQKKIDFKVKFLEPVSVIICAKNEEKNIASLIEILLNQNYPNYEILIIDDASSDKTQEIIEAYELSNSKIKLVKVENNEAFWGNKKWALTLGIKAAKYENLLFTDADCKPTSENWIQEMTKNFQNEKTIILGYSPYQKVKNSWLNKLIRFETLFTALQYFSWAKKGKAYMGVGRNLAYKKTEFFNQNGFVNHIKVYSGDDDLFVNAASNHKNTAIEFSKDSFVLSEPKKNWKDWILQKRRHLTTAKYYKFFDKFQLAFLYISQLLFFIFAIILLSFLHQWIIVLSLIGFRYLLNYIIIGKAAIKLKETSLTFWYPFLEINLIIVQFYIFFKNIISKPKYWR
jgi:glycosyltransferase involved in cell wall biosynthesis